MFWPLSSIVRRLADDYASEDLGFESIGVIEKSKAYRRYNYKSFLFDTPFDPLFLFCSIRNRSQQNISVKVLPECQPIAHDNDSFQYVGSIQFLEFDDSGL
jgi:hypothetical protein